MHYHHYWPSIVTCLIYSTFYFFCQYFSIDVFLAKFYLFFNVHGAHSSLKYDNHFYICYFSQNNDYKLVPPSIHSVCPVTNPASSEIKNSTPAAIYSGLPNLCIGMIVRISFPAVELKLQAANH